MSAFEQELIRDDPSWSAFKDSVCARLSDNPDLIDHWQPLLEDVDPRGRMFAFTALHAVLDVRQSKADATIAMRGNMLLQHLNWLSDNPDAPEAQPDEDELKIMFAPVAAMYHQQALDADENAESGNTL